MRSPGVFVTRSVIIVVIRSLLVLPSTRTASAGIASGLNTPAVIASSISWFKKAMWSA